jgi:hypothetical protein
VGDVVLRGAAGHRLRRVGRHAPARRAGETDLVNDMVAKIRDAARPRLPCWLITEVEDEPEPGIFVRMGKYEMALLDEVNPKKGADAVGILSLVVNLTGRQREAAHEQRRGRYGTRIAPLVVDVSRQDASATLERIERGELGLTILPFCALMKGGGSPAFIKRWKSVVEKEKDEARRLLYRDWVLVMAELTKRQVNWQKALEGWMERKSMIIDGWIGEGVDKGRLQEKRAAVLRVMGRRLRQDVPEPIRLAVEGTNDLATLDKWLDAAADADNLADLRRGMKLAR